MRNILVWTWRTALAGLVGMVAVVAVFRIVPPAFTPLMMWRFVQAPFTGTSMLVRHQWASADNVSPTVFRAVINSEDRKFYRHGGIDWDAVRAAERANPGRIKRGKPPRGASTITMQTAKNVFLVPWRSMVRKAFEVVFVYLIEALWGKQRILEVYVNMIEWGDGIYGVQQAARQHFGTTAAQIRPDQAGLLAAVLPNPRKFNAGKPSPYIKRKASGFRGRVGGGARSK